MSPRDKRALVAGAGVIVTAVLLLRAGPAVFRRYLALRHEAAARLSTLERARATLGSAREAQESFAAAAGEIVALAPKVLAGSTVTEAAATLATDVSLFVSRSGLRVISLNATPDSGGGTLAPVSLRGELEGDIIGLAEFLRAVEGSRTLLSVTALHVLAEDPLERQGGPERLRVTVTIVGWRVRSAGW